MFLIVIIKAKSGYVSWFVDYSEHMFVCFSVFQISDKEQNLFSVHLILCASKRREKEQVLI